MPSAILVCNVERLARHFGGNLLVGRGTLQTTLIALRHNSYCCSMQTANPNQLGPAPCDNVVVGVFGRFLLVAHAVNPEISFINSGFY